MAENLVKHGHLTWAIKRKLFFIFIPYDLDLQGTDTYSKLEYTAILVKIRWKVFDQASELPLKVRIPWRDKSCSTYRADIFFIFSQSDIDLFHFKPV